MQQKTFFCLSTLQFWADFHTERHVISRLLFAFDINTIQHSIKMTKDANKVRQMQAVG